MNNDKVIKYLINKGVSCDLLYYISEQLTNNYNQGYEEGYDEGHAIGNVEGYAEGYAETFDYDDVLSQHVH